MTDPPAGTTRPLALVTGASSGIGLEIAERLAQRRYDLVVNAEDDALTLVAEKLSGQGTSVTPVRADLRSYDAVESVFAAVSSVGRRLDVAVLNAGVGRGGAFVDTELAHDLEIIELNVTSTVHLAKRVLTDMVGRGSGRVLITSSIASTMPGSFQSVYNASKSFLQSFAVALQDELKDSPVTVTSLMPGATETNFFRRANMLNTRVGRSSKDDPGEVADQAIDALLAGEDRVVAASMKTKLQEAANKVLPDRVKAGVHRSMAEPDSEQSPGR